jgi:pSer/pThr/pTyr-binding forkhead associated (FHA) protein
MFSQDASKNQDPDLPAENEYLIIGGVHVVPLRQKVINIGRQQDNTVVIDDPRISRHHAQLHAVHGRYVIFDLGSTGGTYINGHRAQQSVVYPGDIISLAGVELHYIRDLPVAEGEHKDDKTSPLGPGERVTALLRTWFLRSRR